MQVRINRAAPGSVVNFTAETYNVWASCLEYACKLEGAGGIIVDDDPQGGRLVRNSAGPGIVRAKVSSVATGSGYYNLKPVVGYPSAVDPTAAVSLPDTGETVSSTEDMVLENSAETGIPTSHWIALNSFVTGFVVGATNESPSRPILRVWMPPANTTFIVNLAQTAGSDGSSSSYATWTYNVFVRKADATNGTQIGSALSPVYPRYAKLSVIKATVGLAYYDSAGNLVLADAREQANTTPC